MKILQSNEGFTLLEVIIALAVLTVGILGMNSMQIQSINWNVTANNISDGAAAGAGIVEQIFAMDYDDLKDKTGNGFEGLAGLGADTIADADDFRLKEYATDTTKEDPTLSDDYEVFWNVAEERPVPDTKTIHVIVKRTERGITKKVVFEYIKAKVVTK